MIEILKKQDELIRLLKDQITEISMISKVELGDDVIEKIQELDRQIFGLILRGMATPYEIADNGQYLSGEEAKEYSVTLGDVPFVDEVEEFNHTFGKINNYVPTIPEEKEWKFVYDFVQEELEEYREACEKGNIVEVLDALCDITYVSIGNGVMLHGLKAKIWPAYQEVQASNMSKSCETEAEAMETVTKRAEEQGEPCHFEKVGERYVVYRTRDRKVMKSINYFKPDLSQFFTNEELANCHKPSTLI